VREDYGATGEAWDSFPHDHARGSGLGASRQTGWTGLVAEQIVRRGR
jgi:hypothetical protein